MPSPVFSIITVTYNAVKTIEKTIQSVLRQDKSLFEYIIIDGGSSDGTVDCIKQYGTHIAFWSSEKDSGIYEAMNKGINKAKGDWILFLGGDDRLEENVLKEVYQYLDNTADLVYGNITYNNGKRFMSSFNPITILNNTVHHQGAFYNRNLFNNFKYDIQLKIMSDYELNLMIYLSGAKRKKIQINVAECDLNGASSSTKQSLNEIDIIHSKHFGTTARYVLKRLLKIKYFIHYELLRKI